MTRIQIRLLLASAALVGSCTPAGTQSARRESPAEIRRIIAQAMCLAEAYPNSPIATDSAAVVAVYQGALGGAVGVEALNAVRAQAKAAEPGKPTPVGERNLGIARCVLFADRPDVLKLLGGTR